MITPRNGKPQSKTTNLMKIITLILLSSMVISSTPTKPSRSKAIPVQLKHLKTPKQSQVTRGAEDVILPEHVKEYTKQLAPYLKKFRDSRASCLLLVQTNKKLQWQGKQTVQQGRQTIRNCRRQTESLRLSLLNMKIALVKHFAEREKAQIFIKKLKWWNDSRGYRKVVRKYIRKLRREWREHIPNLIRVSSARAQVKFYTDIMDQKRYQFATKMQKEHEIRVKKLSGSKQSKKDLKLSKERWTLFQTRFLMRNLEFWNIVHKQYLKEKDWSIKNESQFGVRRRLKHLKTKISDIEAHIKTAKKDTFKSYLTRENKRFKNKNIEKTTSKSKQ